MDDSPYMTTSSFKWSKYSKSMVKNLILLITGAADDFLGVPFFPQTISKQISPNMGFFGGRDILLVKESDTKLMILENKNIPKVLPAGNIPQVPTKSSLAGSK